VAGCRIGTRGLTGKEEWKMNKTERVLVVLGSVFCLVLLGSSAFSQGLSEEFLGQEERLLGFTKG